MLRMRRITTLGGSLLLSLWLLLPMGHATSSEPRRMESQPYVGHEANHCGTSFNSAFMTVIGTQVCFSIEEEESIIDLTITDENNPGVAARLYFNDAQGRFRSYERTLCTSGSFEIPQGAVKAVIEMGTMMVLDSYQSPSCGYDKTSGIFTKGSVTAVFTEGVRSLPPVSGHVPECVELADVTVCEH